MKKLIRISVLLLLMIQVALFNNHMVVKAEPLNNNVENSAENDGSQSVSDYFKEPVTNENKESSNGSSDNKNSSVVNSEDTNSGVGISVWDVVKAVLAFVFVVGLLLYLLKFISKKSHTYNQTQLLDNLGGIPLGNQKSIQIVKVGSRILIVGVGENIQLLKEITDPNDYNEIIEGFNEKMDQLANPSDIVTKVMNLTKGKMNNNLKDRENKETDKNFQNMFNKQLNEIQKSRKRMLDEIDKKGTDK